MLSEIGLTAVLWLGDVDTQGAVKRPEHTLLTQTLLTQSLGQSRTQSCVGQVPSRTCQNEDTQVIYTHILFLQEEIMLEF